MSDVPKAALLFMEDSALRRGLAQHLNGMGYVVNTAMPEDLPDHSAWHARVDHLSGLALLVHGVAPPRSPISQTDFADFEHAVEAVLGSLWIGSTVCSQAMRARGGGAILVLVPPAGDAPMAAMFGDGLRALSGCLGVGYAEGDAPVRVISVAAELPDGADPALEALIAFLSSNGASYVTATSIG